jgi:formamidopyrimidine-DNA glycosylase
MPELPEVETVVVTLRPRVVGHRICDVVVHRQDVISPAGVDLVSHLRGATVTAIERRGKRIIVSLADGNRFYVHLGMTGRLLLERPDAPLLKHTHVVLRLLDDDAEVRFIDARRFGGIWWLGRDALPDEKIGPEPLTLSTADLGTRLKRTSRAIKVALLDQRLVAGLGNIYVDEALHRAGIHPLTPAGQLKPEQVEALSTSIKAVLTTAIASRGSSLRNYVDADGNRGGFQLLHRVYGRAGQPCDACGKPIKRIVLSGRSTHFCPACQKRGRQPGRPVDGRAL